MCELCGFSAKNAKTKSSVLNQRSRRSFDFVRFLNIVGSGLTNFLQKLFFCREMI